MSVPRIRPLALCIFQKDQQLLVYEGYDPVKQKLSIARSAAALNLANRAHKPLCADARRVACRDLQSPLSRLLRKHFVYNGIPGHELIQVYRAEFVDSGLYDGTPQASEIDGNRLKPLKSLRI